MPPMKLLDWMKANEMSDVAFAERVGRSKWAVRKWIYGQRVPRRAELLQILEITSGAVTPSDFLEIAVKTGDAA